MKVEKISKSPTAELMRHFEAIREAAKQALIPDRVTIEYPRERRKYPDNLRGFIVFEKSKCISCFRCAHICPANAIQMSFYENSYPGIDYTKCIFCHFCIDSCPTGALALSTLHDMAFRSLEEMKVKATQMTALPKIAREDKCTVEYQVDKKSWKLIRKKELEEISVLRIVPKIKSRKAFCGEPESCIGCRQCVEVCLHDAIKFERYEITLEGKVVGEGGIIKIITEDCVGCGLCVRQCPMQILILREVD
ncbi:MAG: 4Fe-4S binding protein [Archaeoglobaceae archaeon]|nr:4Fe-4S binding protein [Archaeoglobaceae archaeon]MDW8117598.1 4Fe-4S binding protein [Archaeoglobaceae archaeon]